MTTEATKTTATKVTKTMTTKATKRTSAKATKTTAIRRTAPKIIFYLKRPPSNVVAGIDKLFPDNT